MVNFCAIYGCGNRGDRDRTKSFYRLPAFITRQCKKTEELSSCRRTKWLALIKRDIKSSNLPYVRVCSDHFITGKPSGLFDSTNPDWAPSLKLGHSEILLDFNQKTVEETLVDEPVEQDQVSISGSLFRTRALESKTPKRGKNVRHCSCCVPNCNGNGRHNPELSFHQIPKRLELRKAWMHAIQRDPGPFFRIGAQTVVCSRHFKKDDFKWASVRKRLLKRESVPSIFVRKSDNKPAQREILKHPVPEKMPRFDKADNDNRDSTENSNEGSGNFSTASGRRGGRSDERRCVAGRCSSKMASKNGISLHVFPLNRPAILRQWVDFVRETRQDWSGPTKISALCSLHFTEECYPAKFKLMDSMNAKFKKRTLEWDAVPTIQAGIFSPVSHTHHLKVDSMEGLSSTPRRSLRRALQTRDADRTPKKTKVSRPRKNLVSGRLRKSDRRRKEVLDWTSVLSAPSDTSYAVYIDNAEDQPSDVSGTTDQVALSQWNSGIVPVDTEETSVNRPGTTEMVGLSQWNSGIGVPVDTDAISDHVNRPVMTELVALSQWNSGIDVCEDLKPIVVNPVTSTTEENGYTMSPQNQDICSGGKCVENRPELVHVKTEPECSFIESEPEYIVVKSEPECSYVKSEPECIDVKSEPECIDVKSEPECIGVKNKPECSYVKNEPENTCILSKDCAWEPTSKDLDEKITLSRHPKFLRL